MKSVAAVCLVANGLMVLGGRCLFSQTPTWKDPSPHQVQFVHVGNAVQIEVLDWGGSGRAVVLLAGSGNSAHVFDDFAPKLTDSCHVYGITRRGYGASSHPESGYSAERLGEDVVAVLDALHLTAPVLVGHSLGGHELTAVVSAHPSRIAGLVYMDSTADPTFDWKPYQELRKKLPSTMTSQRPSLEESRSFELYRQWQRRTMGIAFPESELRNVFAVNSDGGMGTYMTSKSVGDSIFAGMRKPDYSRIRVPVLAFFVAPKPLEYQIELYQPKNADERAAIGKVYAADLDYAKMSIDRLRSGVPNARVVELGGANHYVFLSNEPEVLRWSRLFLADLR
jgi:pimeloyl-ACP methyl ester carboxylesterase